MHIDELRAKHEPQSAGTTALFNSALAPAPTASDHANAETRVANARLRVAQARAAARSDLFRELAAPALRAAEADLARVADAHEKLTAGISPTQAAGLDEQQARRDLAAAMAAHEAGALSADDAIRLRDTVEVCKSKHRVLAVQLDKLVSTARSSASNTESRLSFVAADAKRALESLISIYLRPSARDGGVSDARAAAQALTAEVRSFVAVFSAGPDLDKYAQQFRAMTSESKGAVVLDVDSARAFIAGALAQ